MAHINARKPEVPESGLLFLDVLSKAELLEILWSFASRCNDSGSSDDHLSTGAAILTEANHLRDLRGAKRVRL